MCGRYALYGPVSRLREHFGVDFDEAEFRPRFNLAPQQFAPVIRQHDGARCVSMLRWGLLPAWSKDVTLANRLINARAESAAAKPAFRAAFKSRRCLIPADGFYEWASTPTGKQPYFVHLKSEAPLALAGLWEQWTGPDGESLATFTILTTEANALLASIHERMPVILPPEAWGLWLHPARTPAQVMPLLLPYPDAALALRPVSRRVGNVKHDDAALVEEVTRS
jgi:putative SOS response-associated peptidase YedK